MSDIEELEQLLGQSAEDLDWGGEHFCFLEYEHDQTVVANQQLHHPQQDIQPASHIMYVDRGKSFPRHSPPTPSHPPKIPLCPPYSPLLVLLSLLISPTCTGLPKTARRVTKGKQKREKRDNG